MPFSPDHWALVALVNVAILLTMLVGRSTSLETVGKAFPTARVLLLIAYGAAALSKWNTAFLDPVTSCANMIAGIITYGLAGPVAESHLVNHGTIATESMIFLLLVIPRTRNWGVLLGLAFHFTLSASPIIVVGDYTSTVYALFFLFLRPDVIGRVLDRTSSWASRSAVVRDARRRPPVTAVLAFVVLGFGGHVLGSAPVATLYVLEQFYFVPLMLATALAVREKRADGPDAGSASGASSSCTCPCSCSPWSGSSTPTSVCALRGPTRCSPTSAPSLPAPTTCSCRRGA